MLNIHKEGYIILKRIFILMSIPIIIISFFSISLASKLFFLFSIIYFFIVWFFRNPNRNYIINAREIVAPADGKIIAIKKTFEHEVLKTLCIQISIFMSPFNVHVTRYPVSGKVIYSKYHPGKYLFAWHKKSSTKNEHTTITVRTKEQELVLFRQIAGFVARRIVLYTQKGFEVEAGKEFGFIKFGSRLDIFLPLNFKILVKIGQKTIGAKTILAKY